MIFSDSNTNHSNQNKVNYCNSKVVFLERSFSWFLN